MDKSVFEYKDYRSYLLAKLGPQGSRTGLRARVCKALGCHPTYLSQVLTSRTELSLEYAEDLNRFFSHGAEEADFFLMLLQKERAGTNKLRERFQKQIDSVRTERATLKKQLSQSNEISEADQDKFYSTWMYGALHVLASLPSMKSVENLADALGLSIQKTTEALAFLEKIGLIIRKGDWIEVGPRHVHLGAESQRIEKHHTNWRFHAIQALGNTRPGDLHYSGAVGISREAAQMIREVLLKTFQQNMAIVKDAKEEVAYVYNFDFYRLDNSND